MINNNELNGILETTTTTNPEGDDLITSLLNKIQILEEKIEILQSRLKLVMMDDVTEKLIKLQKSHDDLLNAQKELEEEYNILFVSEQKFRKLTNDAKEAAIEVHKHGSPAARRLIQVKILGSIDTQKLGYMPDAILAQLDSRLRELGQCIIDIRTPKGVKRALVSHIFESIKQEYGVNVAQEIEKAALELDEYNPSGFYPVTKCWNEKTNKEMTPAQVIYKLGGIGERDD
eukprot:NODE_3187_length_1405_cov_42.156786_g2771_i0.p1 GENE.NODE_3187_length_1405_cov_42.156786_g2771_i0~~NODE_3187_length_1405_cov_42.156786_g2771_i0.p1  ORF type:complete len:231 (-),score=32.07 NODE_3187_length_1405_cov_42.156786_g2771_i0:110-802(-)